MTNLEIATVLLYQNINKVLECQAAHPEYIVRAMKRFLAYGCESRGQYEDIVIYAFRNDRENRNILLEV